MSNIITKGRPLDFEVEDTGFFDGRIAKIYNIKGRRSSFPNTTGFFGIGEGIGTSGATYWATLTGTETIQAVSTSIQDTDTTGTGIRQIKVTYIDINWNLVTTSVIPLNGTTPVTVCTDMRSFLFAEAVATGTNLLAVGTITIQINTPVTISQITAGNTRTYDARFTIPTGYTGYILNYFAVGKQNSQDIRVLSQGSLYDSSLQSNLRTLLSCYVPADTISPFITVPYAKVPAMGTFIGLTQTGGTSATTRADLNIQLLIVQN